MKRRNTFQLYIVDVYGSKITKIIENNKKKDNYSGSSYVEIK